MTIVWKRIKCYPHGYFAVSNLEMLNLESQYYFAAGRIKQRYERAIFVAFSCKLVMEFCATTAYEERFADVCMRLCACTCSLCMTISFNAPILHVCTHCLCARTVHPLIHREGNKTQPRESRLALATCFASPDTAQ